MVQSLHVKLTEGDKPRWKTLASSTNVTSANQLPGPGDHTVNDSALFFFCGDITSKPAHHILTQN